MNSFREETLLFIHTQHIYGAKLLLNQTSEHLRELDNRPECREYNSLFFKVKKSILNQLNILKNGINDVNLNGVNDVNLKMISESSEKINRKIVLAFLIDLKINISSTTSIVQQTHAKMLQTEGLKEIHLIALYIQSNLTYMLSRTNEINTLIISSAEIIAQKSKGEVGIFKSTLNNINIDRILLSTVIPNVDVEKLLIKLNDIIREYNTQRIFSDTRREHFLKNQMRTTCHDIKNIIKTIKYDYIDLKTIIFSTTQDAYLYYKDPHLLYKKGQKGKSSSN